MIELSELMIEMQTKGFYCIFDAESEATYLPWVAHSL